MVQFVSDDFLVRSLSICIFASDHIIIIFWNSSSSTAVAAIVAAAVAHS